MNYKNSSDVIESLRLSAKEDESISDAILASIQAAKAAAKTELDSALFAALPWPTTFDEYLEYLAVFSRWTPQQSGDDVWLSTNPANPDEHQEVYDRLCHFYFLIDQPGPDGKVVQNIPAFADWLVSYADLWGSYLNTTESFNNEILQSFIDYSPLYRVEDSMIDGRPNAASGWLTFNQFFSRELNPGLRSIADPFENTTVTAPADCTFRAMYPIQDDSSVQETTVKGTHTFGNIADLLEGSPHAESFAGGTFTHYFLNTYSYHRFHTPVAGKLLECRPVQGKVFLDVQLQDGQFDAPDSSTDGYEFTQARGVVVMDTAGSPYGDIGLVAIIPIGMAQVSSVNMTAQINNDLLKGDEFGYFLFGGSDIIVLYQAGATPTVDTDGSKYRHYGTPIASAVASE